MSCPGALCVEGLACRWDLSEKKEDGPRYVRGRTRRRTNSTKLTEQDTPSHLSTYVRFLFFFSGMNEFIMGLRYVSCGRNELCTRARKLFICNVETMMTKNITASQKIFWNYLLQ